MTYVAKTIEEFKKLYVLLNPICNKINSIKYVDGFGEIKLTVLNGIWGINPRKNTSKIRLGQIILIPEILIYCSIQIDHPNVYFNGSHIGNIKEEFRTLVKARKFKYELEDLLS